MENSSSCFEDIASRGPYLTITARRKTPVVGKSRGRAADQGSQLPKSEDNSGLDRTLGADKCTTCPICARKPSEKTESPKASPTPHGSDEDEDSSDGSSSSLPSNESEDWNSAEESWSEGSTEPTENERAPWNTLESSEKESGSDGHSSESENESEGSEDETASNAPAHSYSKLKEESDSDGGDIEFDCGSDDDAYEGDSDYGDSEVSSISEDLTFDSDDNDEPRCRAHVRHKSDPEGDNHKGSLMIYNVDSEHPVQLFKFSHPLPIMLYSSPPVFHPSKPLVVWPLCGGEILFADFEGKTYFIRKARPSTTRSMSTRLLG